MGTVFPKPQMIHNTFDIIDSKWYYSLPYNTGSQTLNKYVLQSPTIKTDHHTMVNKTDMLDMILFLLELII